MPKKVVTTKKNISTRTSSSSNMEKILIENFVSLQKVMVNLSSKFDNLTKQLSSLLELFEVSARTLAEKELDLKKGENKKIVEKIDNLLEQNKILARGLSLMHERMVGEEHSGPQIGNPEEIPKRKTPEMPPQNQGMQGYQRSISSNITPQFKKIPVQE